MRSEMFVLKMGVNQSRVLHNFLITIICRLFQPADVPQPVYSYTFYPDPFLLRAVITRGADKSLARPGRKQATATEDFDVHISYLLS